jgi:hypothetical protein
MGNVAPQRQGDTPLPPRSTEIINLEENRNVIYGAQSLAGKILDSKNLEACSSEQRSETGRYRNPRIVMASTMIALIES